MEVFRQNCFFSDVDVNPLHLLQSKSIFYSFWGIQTILSLEVIFLLHAC